MHCSVHSWLIAIDRRRRCDEWKRGTERKDWLTMPLALLYYIILYYIILYFILVWFGLVWLGLAWLGLAWLGLV